MNLVFVKNSHLGDLFVSFLTLSGTETLPEFHSDEVDRHAELLEIPNGGSFRQLALSKNTEEKEKYDRFLLAAADPNSVARVVLARRLRDCVGDHIESICSHQKIPKVTTGIDVFWGNNGFRGQNLWQNLLDQGVHAGWWLQRGGSYRLRVARKFCDKTLGLRGMELSGMELPELISVHMRAKDKFREYVEGSYWCGIVTSNWVHLFSEAMHTFDKGDMPSEMIQQLRQLLLDAVEIYSEFSVDAWPTVLNCLVSDEKISDSDRSRWLQFPDNPQMEPRSAGL